MKFSTSKQELQTALQKVSKATPTRSTLPILSCVLIETFQSKTTLRSTDLELTIQVELPVSVELEGKICLPIKTLLDITNELPETRITIVEKRINVTIETKFGKYNIMGKSYEEFPAIPLIKKEKSIILSGKSLKDVIKKTYFAISTDELKPALTGVLFRLKNESITALSTDGHRLVRYIKRGSISNDIDGDFIAPRKFLNFLQTQNLDDKIREKNFRKLYNEAFDNKYISKFVLGRHWKKIDEKTKKIFFTSFNDYLVMVYAPKFKGWSGSFKTTKSSQIKNNLYLTISLLIFY